MDALPDDLGTLKVGSRLDTFAEAQRSVLIAVAAGLGLAAGFALPAGTSFLSEILFCIAGLSAAKLLSGCATCAGNRQEGVVAAIGAATYVALAGLNMATRYKFRNLVSIGLGAVASGQVIASLLSTTACLPCASIAFLNALAVGGAAGSGLGKSQIEREITPRLGSATRVASWSCALAVPVGVWLLLSPDLSVLPLGPLSRQIGIALPKADTATDLSDLGLRPTGRPTVVLVAHSGCKACTDALAALDSVGVVGITYASVGSQTPDSRRLWERIPSSAKIQVTPSVLFADGTGRVVHTQEGILTTPEGLRTLCDQIDEFLKDSPTPKAKEQKK